MFGFFASQENKMRDNAGNWLELAEKVYHYRRDALTDGQVAELQSRRSELQTLVKNCGASGYIRKTSDGNQLAASVDRYLRAGGRARSLPP